MSEKTESRYMELLNALAFQPAEWKRPMDVGAWDASWHSGYLRRLVKRGDAERVTRGSSRSFEYRITTRGLARLVKDRVPLDEAVVPGADPSAVVRGVSEVQGVLLANPAGGRRVWWPWAVFWETWRAAGERGTAPTRDAEGGATSC